MSGLFSKPKIPEIPAVPPPLPPPAEETPATTPKEEEKVKEEEKKKIKKGKEKRATILTSPLGILSTPQTAYKQLLGE